MNHSTTAPAPAQRMEVSRDPDVHGAAAFAQQAIVPVGAVADDAGRRQLREPLGPRSIGRDLAHEAGGRFLQCMRHLHRQRTAGREPLRAVPGTTRRDRAPIAAPRSARITSNREPSPCQWVISPMSKRTPGKRFRAAAIMSGSCRARRRQPPGSAAAAARWSCLARSRYRRRERPRCLARARADRGLVGTARFRTWSTGPLTSSSRHHRDAEVGRLRPPHCTPILQTRLQAGALRRFPVLRRHGVRVFLWHDRAGLGGMRLPRGRSTIGWTQQCDKHQGGGAASLRVRQAEVETLPPRPRSPSASISAPSVIWGQARSP